MKSSLAIAFALSLLSLNCAHSEQSLQKDAAVNTSQEQQNTRADQKKSSLSSLQTPAFAKENPSDDSGITGTITYDKRLKMQLDDIEFRYKIAEDGSFILIFELENERTQLVIIPSETLNFAETELRMIRSPVFQINEKNSLPNEILFSLLEKNSSYKLGEWEILSDGPPYLLGYRITIPVDFKQESLRGAILVVAQTADEMEKLLSNGGDEY